MADQSWNMGFPDHGAELDSWLALFERFDGSADD